MKVVGSDMQINPTVAKVSRPRRRSLAGRAAASRRRTVEVEFGDPPLDLVARRTGGTRTCCPASRPSVGLLPRLVPGWTRRAVYQLYDSLFILKFADDGRCDELVEWFMLQPTADGG
jgi:hypothetical protein